MHHPPSDHLLCIHSSTHPSLPPSLSHRQARRSPLACLVPAHVAFSGAQRRRLRSALRFAAGSHPPLLRGGPLGLQSSRCPAVPSSFRLGDYGRSSSSGSGSGRGGGDGGENK
ncbi:hypothetical protein CHARACLAT_014315 [Characodon lateralis]|uniref:Uncharacterized protein n=1 Tax=Characodon lateralis TaxID=208331 RepID=A0ABU7EBF9_9TELE|nr:hypothetical protein [Characodon lateralis]